MRYKKITDYDLIIRFLKINFSSPTHWPEWNLLVSKYFNTHFYYFGLFEKDNLIGVCPVHETKSGLIKNLNSGQFHFIPNGGWIINRAKDIDHLKIPVPCNASFECFTLPAINEFGASYSRSVNSFHTLIVVLDKEENEIWSVSINSKRRNMIRKSIKMGVTIVKGEEALSDFYTLYSDGSRLHGFEGLPLDFFGDLIKSCDNINFVPFVAYYNYFPCSALGLVYDKNYAYYWLGATNHDSENFGQGDLLQWEAIRYSKAKGCKYYDLCYIEKERLPHIYEFKKGFSNTEVEISYIQKKQTMFMIMNKLQK